MHNARKYNEVYSFLKVYYSLACRSFLRSFLLVCVLLSTWEMWRFKLHIRHASTKSRENDLDEIQCNHVRLRTGADRVFSRTLLYCNMKGSDEIIQIKHLHNLVRCFKEEKNRWHLNSISNLTSNLNFWFSCLYISRSSCSFFQRLFSSVS